MIIGDEISVDNFQNYSDYLHQHEFTGENCGVEEFKAEHVTKLSFDGHHKVHCQLLEGDRIPAHTGRPRSEDAEKPFENGHMLVASGDGYIRGLTGMYDPEDNGVCTELAAKIIPFYPNWNQVGSDRMCKWAKALETDATFAQLEWKIVTKWHGFKHGARCKYNPWNHRHFWDRVQGENDEVCEQVFSWMSRYSRTMNKLRPIRPCLRSCRCAITAGWLHTVASHL